MDWSSRISTASADGWRAARLAALQGSAFARAMLRETVRRPDGPQLAGRVRVDGLHAAVEILRDDSGVPHIFAANADDALFGLGFVHLQDRFWQMEFYRRVAAGRMAEISGPKAVPADSLMRHVGLERAAEAAWQATPAEMQRRVEPYIAGINAAMRVSPLPLEVRILDYMPQPWRAEDSVTWSKLVSFMLSPAWEAQVVRARVLEEVSLETLLAVDPGYPHDGAVMTPPGAPYGALADDIVEAHHAIVAETGLRGAGYGSNNWAVDAAHTASGYALLACDPHLSASYPPLLYFAHLDCPEFTVAGAGLTGAPGIIWGFNRNIAWGPTAGLASLQDVFVEEFELDSDRYRTPSGYVDAEIREEQIDVRGYPSVPLRIRVTRHGPVISSELPGVRHALALQSSVLDPVSSGAGLLGLFTADDPDSFRRAIAEFKDYNLSFAYADRHGRVGMQVSGSLPKRRPGQGWLPAPGWDAAFDWQGYVDVDDLPHEFEPVAGGVWSANNAPRPAADLSYAGEFLDTFRARRIEQQLAGAISGDTPHTLDDARRMQMDRVSLPMLRLRDLMLRVEPVGATEQALFDGLPEWDGSMDPDSHVAAIVGVTYSRLLDAVLRAKLGHTLDVLLGDAHAVPNLNVIAARSASFLTDLLDREPVDWFGPIGPDGGGSNVSGAEVWTAAVTRAFREATAMLRDHLGSDRQRWTWGRCHRLTLRHGLAEVPALAKLLNVGPYPVGGDANTLFQAGPLDVDPFVPVGAIPSIRLIVELSDPPAAEFALAGGQSGRRGARHATDLLNDWLHGRTRPLHTKRAAIEADGAQRLQLDPLG